MNKTLINPEQVFEKQSEVNHFLVIIWTTAEVTCRPIELTVGLSVFECLKLYN